MEPKIRNEDLSREFYTEEKCFITELSNSALDEDVSIARARVEPGVRTRLHRLRTASERYVLLRGQGEIEVGDLPLRSVHAGDVVLIPAMCPQRITNTGEDDLIFLAICSPRFRMEDYEDVEEAPL